MPQSYLADELEGARVIEMIHCINIGDTEVGGYLLDDAGVLHVKDGLVGFHSLFQFVGSQISKAGINSQLR